jgi:hypothetical protein
MELAGLEPVGRCTAAPARGDQREHGERERDRENTPSHHLHEPIVGPAPKELKKPRAHFGPSRRGLNCGLGDAGSAGVGSLRLESRLKPIEIIMACAAGRISIGEWS